MSVLTEDVAARVGDMLRDLDVAERVEVIKSLPYCPDCGAPRRRNSYCLTADCPSTVEVDDD